MKNKVKASIIIPTLNRAKELNNLLESIVKQTSLADVEIIVVDNGSTDNTSKIIEKFQKKLSIIYDYVNIPGLLTGRHRGSEIASGDVLCFLDDDVELNPHYIHNLVTAFSIDTSLLIATGPCLPNYEIDPPEWLNYFWEKTEEGKYCSWLSLLDLGSKRIKVSPVFIFGLNFCIRKEAIKRLGGFHPDCMPSHLQQYQGDGETGLAFKAIEQGMLAVYDPGLMLKHKVPKERLTLEYFKKRAYYQGVCNSFTYIRKLELFPERQISSSFLIKSKNKIRSLYRLIKKFKKKRKKLMPKEINIMLNEITIAEKEGYNFHQQCFKNDPTIRDWVLKENYWDYKLPE